MCGIAGHLGTDSIKKNNIDICLKSLKERGPDSFGCKFFSFKNNKVSLIHSRLKIIDLSESANQPMSANGYTIIFNGEIYNFKEIKKKLTQRGYSFKTNSDTEVLLKNFIDKKFDSFSDFEGMWAIAIWDDNAKELILSRDRFGQKPLYYYNNSANIYFGSQPNQIFSLCYEDFKINYDKILKYVSAGYRVLFKDNETFFNKIKHFPPGSFATIKNGQIIFKRYWKLKNKINKKIDYNSAKEKLNYLITKSVQNCLVSDQKISTMLSGGVDSNIIYQIIKAKYRLPITTCSVLDDDRRYDESKNINIALRNNNNNKIFVSSSDVFKSDFLSELSKKVNFYQSPVLTISSYLSSFLQKEISLNSIKVNISGIGADELFGGYYQHQIYFLNDIVKSSSFKSYYNTWKKYVHPVTRNPYLREKKFILKKKFYMKSLINNHVNIEINKFFKKKIDLKFKDVFFSKKILKNRMFNELFYENIPTMLFEDDRNHMFNSIENRSPFLDKDLVEFAFTLPLEFLIKDGYGKYILRESFKDTVDNKILFDRKKKGFNFNFFKILKQKKIKEDILDLFLTNKNYINEIVDLNLINLIMNQEKLENSESKFLFSLINSVLFINSKTINNI